MRDVNASSCSTSLAKHYRWSDSSAVQRHTSYTHHTIIHSLSLATCHRNLLARDASRTAPPKHVIN